MAQTPPRPDPTPPLPPPGWYDDEEPGMLRYWDGLRWTEHRAPVPVSGPNPPRHDDEPSVATTKWAWLLAVTPAVFLLLNVVAVLLRLDSSVLPALAGGAVGLVVGLVFQDSKVLADVGVRVSRWWGILLLPVYLVLRTVRARSSVGVPVLWFALALAYLAGSGVLLYGAPPAAPSAAAPAAGTPEDVTRPGPSAAPDEPAPADTATPTPAPFEPTASVERLGGAGVDVECWANGPYGDDYYDFWDFRDAWYVRSPDCSPTRTWGVPGPRERRALRTAYPGEPAVAENLAPLYGICAENDRWWLSELKGRRVTAEMVRVVEGALVLCPKHPKRARADRLLAQARLGGSTA